jgi:excisionase family DNA binding protein
MDKGDRDRMKLWLRMFKSLRISAWLPPGLALGWLATLATFVHSVGIALTAWGATVSVALLAALLVTRLQGASNRNGSPDGKAPIGGAPAARLGTLPSAPPAETAPPPAEAGSRLDSGVTSGTSIATSPSAVEPRVMTADEVASVLRVDTKLVIASISSGRFPGNRIGNYWRVDQEALTRWLQGTYGKS